MRALVGALVALVTACGDDGGGATGDAAPPDGIELTVLEAYGKAWGEPDAAARQRLVEFSTTDNIMLYEPTRTVTARDGVLDAMTQFLTEYPGGSVPIVGVPREAHEYVWLRWEAKDGGGGSLGVGLDLMKLSGELRIERVHSFFGTLPLLLGTNTAVQQALIDAWNETDVGVRATHLQTAVTDNILVAFEGEQTVFTGRAAFAALIANRQTANAGQQYALTTGYLSLPAAFHAAWKTVQSDGTTMIASGVVMAVLAEDGRISELVYWNGTQP
jgi:hypothetical protein